MSRPIQQSVDMNRCVAIGVLGWILWFTQQELRPGGPDGAMRWNQLGWFEAQAPCEAFRQDLVGQLGRISPRSGYTRGTAWMAMIDQRQDGQQLYTVLHCIRDTVDPRGPKGK
jgi:hypothetical protein